MAALSIPWPLHPGHEPVASSLLRAYFETGGTGVPHYAGAAFETLGGSDPDPFRFTPTDLAAVTLLSVTVPAPATIAILEPDAGSLAALLAAIPVALPLVDADDDLLTADRSALVRLWRALRAYPGIGRTVASKLMARKRPSLVPMWDAVVAREFGLRESGGYWWAMRDALRRDDLWRRAGDLVAENGLEQRVSPLRAVDVVTWMHGRDPAASLRAASVAGLGVPDQRRPDEVRVPG
ncbi:DUF6308 family protein [Kineosporia succinea]|uniref:DNA-3-methyladenine glycosylase 2 family protein n=1 Tax=Kineosporia succinea TaxID=84632 RepID=A0ABT9PF08_9ACTN|nr:DUF6308 family protein [Kineosporia succinea]MDP9830760.1 hypothetical protein [Kineosporia succinea]